MNEFGIALLPGDGIGAEVMAETVKVLRGVEGPELRFRFTEYQVGAGEYLRSGDPLPPATVEALRHEDAILLGAMGLPDVRWPSGVEMTPQIDLREILDLYAGLRPLRLYHPDDTPLKSLRSLDLLLIRENTEGLFWARKNSSSLENEARDQMRITRAGSLRLFHYAFREARKRRKHVTLVDKANVLPSMAYFRSIFDEVAAHYPDVQTARVYVDAMALYLIQRPGDFDVVVTENMFGDILSDLGAALVGGMGMAPSADIGDKHAVFQPAHGTAPDIAGKGIANPVATILSAAMMLEWLGAPAAAGRIHQATAKVLENPSNRCADRRGKLTCTAMGDAILAAL